MLAASGGESDGYLWWWGCPEADATQACAAKGRWPRVDPKVSRAPEAEIDAALSILYGQTANCVVALGRTRPETFGGARKGSDYRI